jgi:5-methyltetrahydrofolate--homocysteine methyltransferase
MPLLQEITEVMQTGNAPKTRELVQQGVDENFDTEELLGALIAGMNVVGVKFKNNEVYVPEVLVAARAMNYGLDVLKPLLEEKGIEPVGKVAIGTVMGDMHDIGKNLVKMMMVGAGFEVIDLGTDVKPEQFVQAVKENGVDIVALSALLTTTMVNMKAIIDALAEAGLRDQVKVMVGGAPVTDNFANEIGADSYTPDAASAAEVALSYVS